jgi:SH3-like domain-containing protein
MGGIWTHYDVTKYLGGTNHTDPIDYLRKWGYNTNQFLDLVKAHYNNKAEFDFLKITNQKTLNETGVLSQAQRSDGLYANGPYHTSLFTLHADEFAKTYNGQAVQVIGSADTSLGTYDKIKLGDGSTYWIDAKGVSLYDLIQNQQTVNAIATLSQSTRSDGLYAGGPYRTSPSTQHAADNAKNYNGQQVKVIATAQTATANWSEVTLPNGKTYWIDSRGLSNIANYKVITDVKTVNYPALIQEAKRNDSLYADGPYATSASTFTAEGSAKSYEGQTVQVIKTEKAGTTTWAEIKLTNGSTHWIDLQGLREITDITNTTTVAGSAIMNQSTRNDGMYANGPYLTSLTTLSAQATGKAFNNQTVEVLATAKTALATWDKIKLSNGSTYWIDQRGLKNIVSYDAVTNQQTVNKTMFLNQAERNDGLYVSGPRNTSATAAHAKLTAKQFNHQTVQVLATAKTVLADWAEIRLNNGSVYWIDARGLLDFLPVSNTQALTGTAVLNQSTRNDGMYSGTPYLSSADAMHAVAQGRTYNGQTVEVLATENNSLAGWTKIKLGNGNIYWIDSRGLSNVTTYDAITNQMTVSKTMILEQTSRDDGLYVSGPRRTSATSMHAATTAKQFDQQSVQVLATAKTILADWAEIKLSNGQVYWIDQRGLGEDTNTLDGLNLIGVSDTQKSFLTSLIPAAVSVAKKNGLYPSVMVAQAITEAGWGTSELATNANNFFGIKADATWTGAVYQKASNEVIGGKTTTVTSNFRQYASIQAGLDDYATKVLTSPYYQATLRKNAPSGVTAAAGLSSWATDPNYATNIAKKIQTYNFSVLDQR